MRVGRKKIQRAQHMHCLADAMHKLISLFTLVIMLSGCSVGMAMSGKKDPDLGAIRVGATRGEVELQLGSPVAIQEVDGYRIDQYAYEIGNAPSAGRAAGHAVMDILTLGLWELAGTPIEAVQGEQKNLTIVYDEKDVVTRVGSGPPPVSRKKPEQ